jgi:DNA-binding NarL/FixJ family response regulator
MLKTFQELFGRLGLKRYSGRRYFAFEADLHEALLKQVGGEEQRAEELAKELVLSGLALIRSNEGLKERWQNLSNRQQEITALICLGYSNKQIAARMGITTETVKTHVKNTLVKFHLNGKLELQKALKEWDFSKWDQ